MEVIDRVIPGIGKLDEGVRCARGWQGGAIEIGRQERRDRATERTDRADEGGGRTSQHRGAIEGERLRAEIGRAGGIEHVHAHVVGVGPDRQVRVIEEVRAEVKAITIIGAGGIARGGDSHAFIGDRRAAGRGRKLSDDPAIGQLIIEDDGIAGAARLAGAAEAAPE